MLYFSKTEGLKKGSKQTSQPGGSISISWIIYEKLENWDMIIGFSSSIFCVYSKGQLISKGLFAILEFLQKTNETIRHM